MSVQANFASFVCTEQAVGAKPNVVKVPTLAVNQGEMKQIGAFVHSISGVSIIM